MKKGILRAFDAGSYTASVELLGSRRLFLTGLAVSRGLPSAEMTAGRMVGVAFFDESNPADAVVIAVYA